MFRAVRASAIALSFFTFASYPAVAAPMDLLFNTPHLEGTPSGSTLVYSEETRLRLSAAADMSERSRRIELTVQPGDGDKPRPIQVTMEENGHETELDTFRNVPGNPVLMMFLEGVVRNVAQATGGSPFYLRNRLKDGLRDGLVAEGKTLTMRPLMADPNRAQMGAFAGLEVVFELDEDVPGMFRRMTARTGEGTGGESYFEEIRYEPEN